MKEFIEEFINYLSVERGLAHNTLLAYKIDLLKYIGYLNSQGVDSPAQVKKDQDYIDSLGWRGAFAVKQMAEITELGIEIGGLEVARQTINAAYQTALGAMNLANKSLVDALHVHEATGSSSRHALIHRTLHRSSFAESIGSTQNYCAAQAPP